MLVQIRTSIPSFPDKTFQSIYSTHCWNETDRSENVFLAGPPPCLGGAAGIRSFVLFFFSFDFWFFCALLAISVFLTNRPRIDLERLRPGRLAKVIVKPPFKAAFRQTRKDWERK